MGGANGEAETWVEVISKRRRMELRREDRAARDRTRDPSNTYFSAEHKDVAVEKARGRGVAIT
ncbi:hypothetical protein Scep_009333 [Stephania cephalantha]|uniref:Uncharacterized protein n=1 Tax=Stephania cephalantha TaxID=152367 RepID=A0AAP0JVE2_9MAGN